ncbi:MAG: hypothetical protein ACFE9L_17000 [Candidatus Hodarchaeota archaeon]
MNKMKNKALGSIILLGTIGFLVVSIFRPTLCAATVVWSDNFDDGNYDGWTVQNGSFSAADHSLQASGSLEWHLVNHSSSIAYETWSIDVYINTTDIRTMDYIQIFFMSNVFEMPPELSGYCIHIHLDPEKTPYIGLKKGGNPNQDPIGRLRYPEGISG